MALVLVFSFTGTALAVEVTTVTPIGTDVTATLVDNQKVNLTVSNLTANAQYLILMVSGLYTDPTKINVTASTIRYIDQTADASGTISATVYPDSLQTSTICISGADTNGLKIVATVEVPYIRGDANLDTYVTLADATAVAQHSVHLDGKTLIGNAYSAADVTKDGQVTLADATKIAQFSVHLITSWD